MPLPAIPSAKRKSDVRRRAPQRPVFAAPLAVTHLESTKARRGATSKKRYAPSGLCDCRYVDIVGEAAYRAGARAQSFPLPWHDSCARRALGQHLPDECGGGRAGNGWVQSGALGGKLDTYAL